MLEIKGKVNPAIYYAKVIEDEAIDNLVILAVVFGVKVDDILVVTNTCAGRSA